MGDPAGNDVSAAVAGKVHLDRFLLEATPDQDIVREVQCLGGLIHQHVDTHYHLRETASPDRDVAATLVALGFSDDGSSNLTAQQVVSLCTNPTTRQIGLRHVILRTLFQSIDWQSPGPVGLLPDAAAAFIQRVPTSESQSQSDHEAVTIAITKWLKFSAFLLHPQRSQRTPLSWTPTAENDAKVEKLTGLLNTFLGFFMEQDAHLRQEQANHLRGVVAECAKLGYLLFSQPSDFKLLPGHESGRDKSSRSHSEKISIIVEAGLDKGAYHDEYGMVYPSVTHLLEPTFAATGV
ncbi:hypothetical protein VHEMI03714 [[Torrubiella] hemipterigena]|uniref:Uncharacterized protein n=1 Tax=[Torrubiella] hemipterigena TaxID=1531966 RepID=A0A0A1SZB1_9HYPO|nr:hypothetical protein VHEMI03714 [[Torrubiella] hemipterigena]